MNRSTDSTVEPVENDPAPESKSHSQLYADEELCQPSRSLASSSPRQSDTLALPKGEALGSVVAGGKFHEDFVVPISQASKEVSPKPKKLLRKPDLFRHLSDDAILPFPDSSDHEGQMKRRHSDAAHGSRTQSGGGHLRSGSLDSSARSNLDGDDDNTTQSSNYNSFATDGTRSGEDGNSAGQSDESSHEEARSASIPVSIRGEACGESIGDSSSSSSAPQRPLKSEKRGSSPEIEQLSVAMASSAIGPQKQRARSAPLTTMHMLSTIPQDSALEEQEGHARERFLRRLAEDSVSMASVNLDSTTSMPSLSSIHWDEVSYHQSRSLQSFTSISSSSSDMKHSLEGSQEGHSSESTTSSEPRATLSGQTRPTVEGKAGTKQDVLSPVLPQKSTRRTSWDRLCRSGEKDSPPSLVARPFDTTFQGEVPFHIPREATFQCLDGINAASAKRSAATSDTSQTTPRIKNPKKSSRQIASAVKAIVGSVEEASQPILGSGNDTAPRVARRRSSSSASSFSAGS